MTYGCKYLLKMCGGGGSGVLTGRKMGRLWVLGDVSRGRRRAAAAVRDAGASSGCGVAVGVAAVWLRCGCGVALAAPTSDSLPGHFHSGQRLPRADSGAALAAPRRLGLTQAAGSGGRGDTRAGQGRRGGGSAAERRGGGAVSVASRGGCCLRLQKGTFDSQMSPKWELFCPPPPPKS